MLNHIFDSCWIWNLYGPAKTTLGATYHLIQDSVPIRYPLANYQCLVLDTFFQTVTSNQQGELFIGGVGVFAGYLERDDLTDFKKINGQYLSD
jgi:non-ribosomal peptide synthetase component F